MAGVIVVFPKIEDAQSICRLLRRSGFSVRGCTGQTGALQLADEMNEGIVICSYRIRGMLYTELLEKLPSSFHMLLIASSQLIEAVTEEGIESLALPLKTYELTKKVEEMLEAQAKEKKNRKTGIARSARQKEQIDLAKKLLMDKNQLTEDAAHRYLQKISMDSGRNLLETAAMIVSLMSD